MFSFERFASRSIAILATAAMLLISSPARGASVTQAIAGDGALGDFTGSLTYTYTSGNTADLAVYLKNISNPAGGGYLTGFVFNINADDVTARLYPNPTEVDYDRDIKGLPKDGYFFDLGSHISASPYGTFDAGAGLAGGFNGSGKPQYGLGSGEEATFHFRITGRSDLLDGLSPMTFLSEMSGQGDYSAGFLVRFRGFENGGSDKVPGCNIVPLPPAAWAGAALFGIVVLRGVKRKLAWTA